ncbi:hypothetical protein T492DRAFT_892869, partial [Pavlovales sp. CCMP2436]
MAATHGEVPLAVSLTANAPGYAGDGDDELGPLCWKCNAPKVPHAGRLEHHLSALCTACCADELVLFERATFLEVFLGASKLCGVCAGKGRLPPTQRRRKQFSAPAIPPFARRPPGWTSPGPAPATAVE